MNPVAVTLEPRAPVNPSAPSSLIHHILLCLDRSAASEKCLPYAAFAADVFAAKVTLLHVLPSPSAVNEPTHADALDADMAKKGADDYLHRTIASLGWTTKDGTVGRVAQGFPAEQIEATAREVHADLTILARQGEGTAGTFQLGSIAQHVLARASGSVLLVDPGCSASVPPKRILVPLDGSVRSESVLPIVVAMAHAHDAEVLLVHVVTTPVPTEVLGSSEDLRLATALADRLEHNAQAYLANVREQHLSAVRGAKTRVVRRTDERQALLDVAVEWNADMLALTAHGLTCNAERVFGSVTSFLVAYARLPLFVAQDVPRLPARPSPQETPRHPVSARPVDRD